MKYYIYSIIARWVKVAPLVGAWIEIRNPGACLSSGTVAPLVGAWIEIQIYILLSTNATVAPLVGAWIEIFLQDDAEVEYKMSLPSWERGLKFVQANDYTMSIVSLPSWERGLKYYHLRAEECFLRVAPLVGAWIEICSTEYDENEYGSRSPRGSVD